MKITASKFTSSGLVRSSNQDSLLSVSDGEYGLFVVADGMGGHYGGEIASGRLAGELEKWWNDFRYDQPGFDACCEQIKEIITSVNDSIYNEYSKNGKICGTTLALVFIYENKYLLINVGDSRIYSLNKRKFKQESVDHVFSAEAKLKGDLTDAEINEHKNKNKLTSAVGCKQQFKMNVRTAPIEAHTLFICSDGVYKYCTKNDIKSAMKQSDNEKAAAHITKKVEKGGAGDNFSFIKISLGDGKTDTISDSKIFAAILAAIAVLFVISIMLNSDKDNITGETRADDIIQSDTDISDIPVPAEETEPSDTNDSQSEIEEINENDEPDELSFDTPYSLGNGVKVEFTQDGQDVIVFINDEPYVKSTPASDLGSEEEQSDDLSETEMSSETDTAAETGTEDEASVSGSEIVNDTEDPDLTDDLS